MRILVKMLEVRVQKKKKRIAFDLSKVRNTRAQSQLD